MSIARYGLAVPLSDAIALEQLNQADAALITTARAIFEQPAVTRAHGIVMTVRCFYCSGFYPEKDVRTIGESVVMCIDCQHKHVKNMLEFTPPPYCQGCNLSTLELASIYPGDTLTMAVHYKDGIYQVLCPRCDELYVQQRKDLFADTRYGYHHKLK